ncbi:hypothetical protein [Pelagovum pacificum]|uniref:Uncharacterized protein n=1 Tax=Pelagovum pacificum TaxID=2588711 RepID=A0A5C5GHL1_9RHOB|nr:hypothetical protein [Pelagovum pacificum]QQA43935.1 hypothetical protein I8N54_04985 [Pelagovum pacificum]TNY32936.1 hypothetical protein FHY64_06565 [Pelagovum pacificum]
MNLIHSKLKRNAAGNMMCLAEMMVAANARRRAARRNEMLADLLRFAVPVTFLAILFAATLYSRWF